MTVDVIKLVVTLSLSLCKDALRHEGTIRKVFVPAFSVLFITVVSIVIVPYLPTEQ